MKGFTLVEILVSVALISILAGLGVFMSLEAYRASIHRAEDATIVSLLQRARSRAMANAFESEWSVCYVAPNYKLVKGPGCIANTPYETIEANVGVATASDFSNIAKFPVIVFEQLTGNTSAETITVVQEGRTAEISTNHEGTIIW